MRNALCCSPPSQLAVQAMQAKRDVTSKCTCLQSIKDLIYKQEKAPPGGFPSIRYARRLPSTGPTGATLFAVGAVVSAYGFYKIGVTNGKRRYAFSSGMCCAVQAC